MELSSVLVMAHSVCCAWKGPVNERSLHQDLFLVSSWQPLKQDATWNRGLVAIYWCHDYPGLLLLHIYRLNTHSPVDHCQLLSRGYSVCPILEGWCARCFVEVLPVALPRKWRRSQCRALGRWFLSVLLAKRRKTTRTRETQTKDGLVNVP